MNFETVYANRVRQIMNTIRQIASEDRPELRNQDIGWIIRRENLTTYLDYLGKDVIFSIVSELEPFFVKMDCRDKSLIAHVLHLARKTRVPHYPQFIHDFMKKRVYGTFGRSYSRESVLIDENYDFMKIFFMPYNEVQVFDEFGDSVMDSAVAGDIALLELLLKFGATILQLPDRDERWTYFIAVIQGLFSYIPTEYIRTSLISNFSQTSERRLFFIILCLEVLIHLKSHQSDSCNYILSFQLLFKAIPEPLVTSKEISNCLEKLLRGPKKDEEIQTVVNEFGNFFPESLQTPGPRTLKHLSRFQIRENLRTSVSAFRLPQAIDSLPLPEKFKDYILLTDEGTF